MRSLYSLLLLSITCRIMFVMGAVASNLPLGDINIVVVTDVHSWVAGHGVHESLDADYGDVLSFYQQLHSSTTRDVWFVMNGDFMDGTGLSAYPPVHLERLLMKMPWDAVNVGNHDIYNQETIQYITRPRGLVESFGDAYLTSNVNLLLDSNDTTQKPLGCRYRYLRGNHATLLTFGFMYNLQAGVGTPLAVVQRVQEVVRQPWFLEVLRAGQFHAILVLAHMSADDPSVAVILSAIRNETGATMPVQFITGHTHLRRYDVLDDWATALEAGRYLDTVGFVSFPNHETVLSAIDINDEVASDLFRHIFLDAKVEVFEKQLGINKLKTQDGQALTDLIYKTQDDMGLRKVVGCSPRTYYMNRTLQDADSLFGLWTTQVIPTQFLHSTNMIVLQGKSSSFRYDLFEGNVTLDDIMIVSPFNDTMYLIASNLSSRVIIILNETMNRKRNMDLPGLPDFILMGNVTVDGLHELYTLEYEVPFITDALQELMGHASLDPKPVNEAATSLWLSFLEEFWSTCGSGTAYDAAGMSKGSGSARFQPTSTRSRKDKMAGVSPGEHTAVLASACSTITLLLVFLLRRRPRRRHSD